MKEFQKPAERNLFDKGCGRSRAKKPGILVPGAGEPISCQGNRQTAANDETEEARPRHCSGGRRARVVQESKRLGGIARFVRKALVKGTQAIYGRWRWCNRARSQAINVPDRPRGGIGQ